MTSFRLLPIKATSRGGNEYPHLLRLTSLLSKTHSSRRAPVTSSAHIQWRGRSAAESYSARAAPHRWSRINQPCTEADCFSPNGKDEIGRLQQVTGPNHGCNGCQRRRVPCSVRSSTRPNPAFQTSNSTVVSLTVSDDQQQRDSGGSVPVTWYRQIGFSAGNC